MYVWKTIKVFLSSTYLDLELERDYLSDIFTRLRQELMARSLSLIPYDLRWHERHSEASIPQWCLGKLRQCQYFVSILGYRYGWRPPLLENGQPNLQRLSITEMEIKEALARVVPQRRLFCFGSLDQYDPRKVAQVSAEDRQSVEILKQQLRDAGEHIVEFHNQIELLSLVESELRRIFQQDYPEKSMAAPLEYGPSEALTAFIQEKIRGFVGRQRYLQSLEKFAQTENYPNYLGIHAVAGTGKSALLARFIEQWKKQHADIPVIAHFMGMSGNSRQVAMLLQWVALQLQQHQILTEPLVSDPGQLRQQVRQALEQCQRRLILVVDGLDEMEPAGHNLLWLPRQLPAGVRVILSTRPVEPWPLLKTYPRLDSLELSPLTDSEIQEIIRHHAQESNVALSVQDVELLQKRAAGNPLYLKVALEQIGAGGVAVGQLATSIESLFEQILQRLGQQYGDTLVWDYLGLITASRYGLTESELRELLAVKSLASTDSFRAASTISQPTANATLPPSETIAPASSSYTPDDLLVAVAFSLQNFLIERGGLLDFFHAEFDRMLKERLGKANMRKYHQRLSKYFQSKGFDYPRTLLELPYQQQWSEKYEELLTTLTNRQFLEKKCRAGMCDGLLEDLQRATEDLVVKLPENAQTKIGFELYAHRGTIQLLAKMLQLDLNFIRRHPKSMMQCLWNRGFWYDSSQASAYYTNPRSYPTHDPRYSMNRLVELWREQPASTTTTSSVASATTHASATGAILEATHTYQTSSSISAAATTAIPAVPPIPSASITTTSLWLKSRRPLNPHLDTPVLKILRGHTAPITSVAWDKEGHRIASCSKDGTAKIWDRESGECFLTLTGHEGAVNALVFSSQGQRVISGGSDHLILVWDAQTGACLEILVGHQDTVQSLAITSDQSALVSASNDGTIRIWNLAKYEIERVITGDSNGLLSVVITPDGKKIVAAANDNSIRVWDRSTGNRLSLWRGHDAQIHNLAISEDGNILASVGSDNTIRLWNLQTYQPLQKLTGHTNKVTCVALPKLAGSQAILSGSLDSTVRIWRTQDAVPFQTLEQTCWNVMALALHDNNHDLLVGAEDGTVSLWDLRKEQANLVMAGAKNPITQWIPVSNQNQALVGSEDGKAYLWDLEYGRLNRILEGHTTPVQSVAASSDQRWLATGSEDGTICLWNFATGKLQTTLPAHKGRVMGLAFLSEGRLLSVGYFDEKIKVWNLSTNKCSASTEGHERWIETMTVSKDGKILITGSRDKTARIWDLDKATCLKVLRGHDDSVTAVALSPDQKLIATGSHNGLIRVWDMASGSSWMILRGHTDLISSIAFSHDGQWIISTSRDRVTMIWDSKNGEILAQFPGFVNTSEVGRQETPYFTLTKSWETAIVSKQALAPLLASGVVSSTLEAEIAWFPTPLASTMFYRPQCCFGIGQIENQNIYLLELGK